MKKIMFILVLAILPLGLFAASGTAIPGGNQSTTFTISKPGAYYLAGNRVMTTKGQPAIAIYAPDVTLDLNGFSVGYVDSTGSGTAIRAEASNVEIRNGSITVVPEQAILSLNGSNVGMRVIDVRLDDTGGMDLGGAAALVERCTLIDSRGTGITAKGAQTVIKACVIRNVRKGNDDGAGIRLVTWSQVLNCNIMQTDGPGIDGGYYSTIIGNQITEANESKAALSGGIVLSVARRSQVTNNTVFACHAAGIRVTDLSEGVVVNDNVVSETMPAGGQVGAGIVSSMDSTLVRGNVGTGNWGQLLVGVYIDGGGNLSN